MDNLIKIIIENTSQISSSSLNSIWSWLGITDISFLRWLQIIFFLIIIILNIWLVYLEYLDKKSKIKDNSELPHIRRYYSYFLAGIAVLYSIIMVKNKDNKYNTKAFEEFKQEEKILWGWII